MSRHIGMHKDSNEQLVVIFMLLPDQQNALVAYPSKLPDHIRRELAVAVQTPEAQNTDVLADALGRRMYGDSQKPILAVLHEMQLLTPIPIDNVLMTPDGNYRIPLRQVLQALKKLPTEAPADVANPEGFNPHIHNNQASDIQEMVGAAKNLIVEAEMLEADARAKRARAYSLAPSLKPPANPEPVTEAAVPEQVAEATEANAD